MPGLLVDTLDKIIGVYFAGVTAEPFTYNGKTFLPKKVHVSPHIFRGSTCPRGCGGCCFRFSLVWMPGEPKDLGPGVGQVRAVVNGIERALYADLQTDHKDHFCRHLLKASGLCGIHGKHPFSCDFELIRFIHQEGRCDIAVRPFGRGWSYKRVTGQTGALCDMLPPTPARRDDAVRKMKRLQEWTDYFQLKTHLPKIISWLTMGPHDVALVLDPRTRPLSEVIP